MCENYEVAVLMKNITKRFHNIVANDRITFDVKVGEIHALLGENGAGKTTLMNILFGHYRPDEGEIYVYGRKVKISCPRDAIKLGIMMIHQHPLLVENLSVLENIALLYGIHDSLGLLLSPRKLRDKLTDMIEKYNLKIDLDAKVWQLSASQKQQVELLKALVYDSKILILDEPTSILTPIEKEWLFSFIRKMKRDGKSVIFITHKLEEAISISDRITVLRRGRVVGTLNSSETSVQELARLMIGEEGLRNERIVSIQKRADGDLDNKRIVLEVSDLSVLDDRGSPAVRGVSFEVYEGEIFGIIGVSGNGQTELVEAITGLRKVQKGRIRIDSQDVTNRGPRYIQSLGVAHIPEHRIKHGIVSELSVAENLVLKVYRKPPFCKGPYLNSKEISRWARELISEFSIVTPNEKIPVGQLSGGNIQRVIVAREVSMKPKLLIAAYPTHGLDIAATRFVREILKSEKDRGCAVLLVSNDIDEVLELCDRIAVMYEGRILKIISAEEATKEKIGLLMSGVDTIEGAQIDQHYH
ncbi:MAG: ABC transporter ATP-binding protein [Candidatus Baldrarchaeia archaeon]